MPTTQQLPHPPLEATGFFQPQPSSGVEVTGVEPPPEGAVSAAAGLAPLEEKEAEQERGKGRTKRKNSPSAESGWVKI